MPPAKPSQRTAFKLGLGPELNVQLYYGLISTMIELGVFRECATEARTRDELAQAARITQREVFGTLLDTLVKVEILERTQDRYSLHPGLVPMLGDEARATFLMFDRLMSSWFDHLGDYLRTGTPLGIHEQGTMSPRGWDIYQRAMSVRSCGRRLVGMAAFDAKPGRILDWAGGIAAVSKPLLDKFPTATSLIIELPNVVAMHDGVINTGSYAGRLHYQTGDVRTYQPEQGAYDVVILSAILHHLERPDVRSILERSRDALAPNGVIAIEHGFPGEDKRSDDPLETLSDLLFHITSGEDDMTSDEFRAMFGELGLRQTVHQDAILLLKRA